MTAPTPDQINHLQVLLSQREVSSILLGYGDTKNRVEAQADALRTLLADWRQRGAQVVALRTALAAVGASPQGFCVCPTNRDATKPEAEHVGKCREARAVLRDTECLARAQEEGKE